MTDTTDTLSDRHRRRMQNKKSVKDEGIARASEDRGVLLVLTGNGKGKSSSGFGMIARALGHDMKAGIVQFIKGRATTGEETFFRKQQGVTYHVMGEGFTWETQDRDRDIEAAQAAWKVCLGMLTDPAIDIILFDELNIALKHGYLDVSEIITALQQRPPMQHVIITGRGAKEELIGIADTVTEMGMIKHAFKQGVRAQKGIEL